MVCSNCGSEIPAGKLYCPFCGEEVQLVPEYSSVDMQAEQKRLADAEEAREEAERARKAEARERGQRMGPAGYILSAIFMAAIAAGLTYGAHRLIAIQNAENTGYLRTQAERALLAEDPETALAYLTHAEEVSTTGGVELPLQIAATLTSLSRNADAAEYLADLAEEWPDSEEVLRAYLTTLENAGESGRVAELVKSCKSAVIREEFSAYLAEAPEFSLMNGNTYAYGTLLTITAQGEGTIHYTTDGSEPDETSPVFTEPILLEAGTNRVRAVFISIKGVKSKTAIAVYNVR